MLASIRIAVSSSISAGEDSPMETGLTQLVQVDNGADTTTVPHHDVQVVIHECANHTEPSRFQSG